MLMFAARSKQVHIELYGQGWHSAYGTHKVEIQDAARLERI